MEIYLEEAVESVINQTIGFEKNIQLILINDGSTDNSEEICLKYQKEYPDNIIYIKQKNLGVSIARNKGVEIAKGKYINFLDADDKWSLDTFEKVYNFFENDTNGVEMVSCRIKFFDAVNRYHPLDYKYKNNKVVDINIEYNFAQLSSSQCFFTNSLIKKYSYDKSVKYSEDMKIINEIIMDIQKYGIISNAVYFYRKRPEKTSAIQTKEKSKDWFLISPIKVYQYLLDLSKEKFGFVLPYIKYVIMYDLQWRIKERPPKILSEDENKKYVQILRELLIEIDDQIILEQRNINLETKIFALNFKNSDFNEKFKFIGINGIYNNLNLFKLNSFSVFRIDVLEIKNNNLELSGTINLPFESEDFRFFIKSNLNETAEIKTIVNDNDVDAFCDGTILKLKRNFVCKRPIEVGENISAYISYKGIKVRIPIDFGKFAKINKVLKNHYYVKDHYLIKTRNNRLVITEKTFKKIVINEYRCLLEMLKSKKRRLFLYRLSAFLIRLVNKKQFWIISDRIDTAGDNGEAFYNYVLSKKNKNIKPYFLISNQSQDYYKLKKKGKVLKYSSLKHKLMFLLSPYIISSHADDYVINLFAKRWPYVSNLYDYTYIFLQHGITKDDQTKWLNKNNKNIALFVTAINGEYKSILTEKYHYTEEEVKLTGFPRYDLLTDNSANKHEKTILVAPTWRQNLAGSFDISKGTRSYNPLFKKSDYFKFYNSLINDERLLTILKKYKCKIKFVLHPAAINQVTDFDSNDYVEIKDKINYKEEFDNNSLLITDYSSVFFDFVYLKKPVIYSQFDKKTFFDGHIYGKGYFSYEDDGFGDVLTTVEEIVNKVEYYIKNDFQMEKAYLKRVEETFAYTDKNNCKRVYEAIKKLK